MDLGGGAGAGMGMGMPKRNPMFDQKIADIIRKRLKLESTVAFRSKLIDLANRMKEDKKFADKESAVQRSQIMLELAQEIGSKPSKQ